MGIFREGDLAKLTIVFFLIIIAVLFTLNIFFVSAVIKVFWFWDIFISLVMIIPELFGIYKLLEVFE